MPIFIRMTGGVFTGYMQGSGEYYDSDAQTILKGTFDMGNLTGSDGVLVEYTDTSFTYYIGTYDANSPNGNMIVYTYSGTTPLSDLESPLITTKQECIYSEGTLISVIDSNTQYVNINIGYSVPTTVSDPFINEFTLADAG